MTTSSNIVLIGFMGTGKSTVGQALARRLGWSFADTDSAVEQQEGTTIAALFAERGEAYFRSVETQVLRQLLERDQFVLATGGGAVLAPANRDCMLERGFVVRLTAERDTILRRVHSQPGRPLLAGNAKQRVTELMEARKHAYDFAHLSVSTDQRDIADIVEQIHQSWKEWQAQ